MVVCLLPKLFDGEIRGKAKSRVGTGEPGTNTIKGLEGLGGEWVGIFLRALLGKRQFSLAEEMRGGRCEERPAGGYGWPSRSAITGWGCCWVLGCGRRWPRWVRSVLKGLAETTQHRAQGGGAGISLSQYTLTFTLFLQNS